ncbi:DNA-directed RNA polymerase I and III subunit RPAC1, putative [Entamoeba invadens IP1]|uniref:DNA-directed RNA polymerases I and III subunit RPAC1 n=1 Tax=Entamoeba invadens IP1 TaxID=370355 RepID=A0A0A1U275_ENTIV|nr:DNA-directed RNA polymerase I and III subunit RPAC1, putative [Entamoeba invadens IP1]ELP86743.1 DNA-directed RNA polymerase I and III subunit RPAC1, putative [Entamoeba invadens IP1]|eukprot:XP_004186089.1 DNA-directed RNA polymerase I and III subunit RPAC1, putative [Entamoeba invadens IP1]
MECEPHIEFISTTPEKVVFDLTNVDVSVANSLRRIMLSEVPTMAIEMVVMEVNTSCIPDEMLAHRLGLIPIYADPRKFQFAPNRAFLEPTEENTLVFHMDVINNTKDKTAVHKNVYSSDIIWEPQGDQETTFQKDPIRVVLGDILIAELAQGQQIKCKLYCCKGLGQDHAKFSPVCTAAYRMMPKIEVTAVGKMAKEIKECCPLNVYDIEDNELVVKNPRNCKMCRECIRDQRQEFVKLGREDSHFIFTVESVGIYQAKEIFEEALSVLKGKAQKCLEELKKRREAQTD